MNFRFSTGLGPDAAMSNHATCATTQPFCIKDMMTHVHADRESELSASGSGDDVSVYWEPISSVTDPFKTYSPDTFPPPPSSLENLLNLPLSPTSSHSARSLEQLFDVKASQNIESFVLTTVPANEEKLSCACCTRHRGALPERPKTLKQISNDDVVGVRIGQAEEGKENKSVVSVCSVVHFFCTNEKSGS